MSIIKKSLKTILIFKIITISILLINCERSTYPYAIIVVNIDSSQELENIRLTLRDDGLSRSKFKAKFTPNICDLSEPLKDLPGICPKLIIKIYDYFGELRKLDTIIESKYYKNFNYDNNDNPLLDGIYKYHFKCLDETDSVLGVDEKHAVLVKEEYNYELYEEKGYLPVFTLIPDDYFYKIDNIPLDPISFTLTDSLGREYEFVFESPYMFCCRDMISQDEICEVIILRKAIKTFVNFEF